MPARLQDMFKDKKVLVVGDVMLDQYVSGKVKRISPEAPVPILSSPTREFILGGAANVAANLASLSAKPILIGAISNDNAGRKLQEKAREEGIKFYALPCNRTIEKIRFSSEGHPLFRIDEEDEITSPIKFDRALLDQIGYVDAVIVSDYAKGMITPQLMSSLLEYSRGLGIKIIAGPKPVNKNLYENLDLLVFNEKEAFVMEPSEDIFISGNRLRDKFKSNLVITRGEKGMSIFNGNIREIPTYAQEVFDVTGAGDTVLATLGLTISSGLQLEDAAIIANHAAGIAVGKRGTSVVNCSELERQIYQENEKVVDRRRLKEICGMYKSEGRKVVWTNGCFDILHEGHIDYLKKARALGDCLIVGLNSDDSVRRIKGPSRPVTSEGARARIISSLEFVDYVVIFSEPNVAGYLQELKPDVYAKGGDYGIDTLNQEERRIVEDYHGKVEIIPLVKKTSTTDILRRIQGTS